LAGLLEAPEPRRELAGWPALVRLALTSQRTLAQQFLWEEVVRGLDAPEARALLALGLIGWADAQTMSALCGEDVDLEGLTTKVPLLSISDDGALRAHDLWAESLERLYSPAEITQLLPAARDALAARHDTLRLVTIAERLGDRDTMRVAARELVSQTMHALPVERARALLAAADPA